MAQTKYKHLDEENARSRKPDRKTLKRLYSYGTPYYKQFIVIFLLIIISVGMTLAQPRLTQMIIDNNISVLLDPAASQNERALALSGATQMALIYLATVLLAFVAGYGQDYMLHKTGQKILRRIRQDLYDHILKLPMTFFDHYPQGSLVTRVTNDTETLNEMFTSVLTTIFRSLITLAGIVVIMYSMNSRLASFVMLLTPAIIIISMVFRRVIRKVYYAQRRVLSMINTKLSENISGMRTIQVFHRQKQVTEEFDEINREYLDLSSKEVQYYATYRPFIEIIRSLGIAALIWFGGRSHLDGIITFGILYAFIDYIQRFFQPILELAETFNLVQSAMTSTHRIFHLMDQEVEDSGGELAVPATGLEGKIEFKNVWFAYNEGEWVLKDVSFSMEPGEFVAFVGATGAGKSTIMHLLCRFYDIDKGQILLDGIDIREYDLKQLRESIGVVQQDVFLYSGSVMENISLNRPEVSVTDVRQAAKIVNADIFIDKLPKRYDEEIMERGSTLSSGQRQLLSFARTIAAKPSLLILDEATANIDTETELLIQDAISKMSVSRSMIAVAHRISTIANADKIIVMHKGRVAEQGTRDQLLARNGLFKLLYKLQYEEY
ncbi:MAG: ABC transporter ATP-binding protein [Clostridiaceae bacterium]|jgi:ATP-binding cassette subfamily B protein|nr:ABC transporter ATP-binding protein [Clostridiaceae bacterium]